jgi:oligosaccharide reducing-end xylanase
VERVSGWRRLIGALLLGLLALSACGVAATTADRPREATSAAVVAPASPSSGAFESGVYRNLFKEVDPRLSDADIERKLEQYWESLFGSDPDRRIYFPGGANEHGPLAYIVDINNDDIRSEGMSYGMMIAVQMDRKAEFDALWNWAKSHMQYQDGPRAGYFQWQCQPEGCAQHAVPASDGEEYFATALFFAAHRWGNGDGIYNYEAEANRILDTMLHKEEMNGGIVGQVTNMFNRAEQQVVFVPYGDSARFTDPSYHLPAFYELWGRWAAGWNGQQAADRQFWLDAAARSRRLFVQAAHPTTGLSPDYAEFDGRPRALDGHGDFRFDAFRTAVNWSVDYAWWAADPNQPILTDRLHAFFEAQGMGRYVNQYSLAGEALSTDRSPGLIASNGAAALAATHPRARGFVEALWALEPPSGRYRYYDGLLQFMALLHASGNFRIY